MSQPLPQSAFPDRSNCKSSQNIRPRGSPINSVSPALDALSFKFAMCAGRAPAPCLDVGCGSGVATRAALVRGARLIAFDPDLSMFHQLLTQLPVTQFGRVSVIPGRLEELNFPPGELSAVHISRVLHQVDDDTLRRGLSDISRWLQLRGMLFVSALTPEGSYWKGFNAEFSRREKLGDWWPGFIRDVSRYDNYGPPGTSCHLLSEAVLRRELSCCRI
jgi:ubiquinone/menaquinone biosynthesis C-methylase UbiE